MRTKDAIYEPLVQEGGDEVWQVREFSLAVLQCVVVLSGVQSIHVCKVRGLQTKRMSLLPLFVV